MAHDLKGFLKKGEDDIRQSIQKSLQEFRRQRDK